MQAWLSNGKGIGTDNNSVSNEYKSVKALKRYAIEPFFRVHGYCKAEIHYDWDTRYGKPNKILVLDKDGYHEIKPDPR